MPKNTPKTARVFPLILLTIVNTRCAPRFLFSDQKLICFLTPCSIMGLVILWSHGLTSFSGTDPRSTPNGSWLKNWVTKSSSTSSPSPLSTKPNSTASIQSNTVADFLAFLNSKDCQSDNLEITFYQPRSSSVISHSNRFCELGLLYFLASKTTFNNDLPQAKQELVKPIETRWNCLIIWNSSICSKLLNWLKIV